MGEVVVVLNEFKLLGEDVVGGDHTMVIGATGWPRTTV